MVLLSLLLMILPFGPPPRPVVSGPLVCQFCESDFLTEEDFARHKFEHHAGEAEYRKRVLYLMAETGCRPITAQEKRIMVQNFAHFQQFCHPGSKANRFSGGQEVPRCEAACAVCAQKDYLEHRHKVNYLALHRALVVLYSPRTMKPVIWGTCLRAVQTQDARGLC